MVIIPFNNNKKKQKISLTDLVSPNAFPKCYLSIIYSRTGNIQETLIENANPKIEKET